MAVHPLIQPSVDLEQPDDLGVIDYPVKKSPAELAYGQTIDVDPDHAAQVLGLARSTGENPQFIENNLDAAKKSDAMPTSDYFVALEKKYPLTHAYVSDPEKMAVAKDDIENLGQHEQLVRDYGVTRTLFNSMTAGFAKVNAQLAAVPQLVNTFASALTERDFGKFPGSETAVKFWQDQARAYTPTINDQSTVDVLKTGNVPLIAKTLTSKLFESAPSLALFMAANAAGGPGAGLAVAGVGSAADVNIRNLEMGLTPGESSVNSLYHGAINAAFMNLGVLSPLHKWEQAIAKSVGVDTARRVVLDMAKTIAGSAGSFGGSMAAMSLGGNMIDASTGVNPKAMAGAGKQALDAFIEGAVTGGAIVGPAAILGGFARSTDVKRTQAVADFYTAMGESAKASKLRERMPDAYREHIDQLTKGTPIENVGIPAEKFDTFFQGKNMNPDEVARDLGVFEQMAAARESGGDISVPLSIWTEKMVKGGYYEAFKNDVRLHPEDMTANEAKEMSDLAKSQVTEAAEKAIKENPGLAAGRDFVYEDLKAQLTKSGQLEPKVIEADSKLGAAVITRLAAMHNMDPKDYYASGSPLRITGTDMPARPEAAEWVGKAIEKAGPPKIKKAEVQARAESIAAQEAVNFEANRSIFDRWKMILKTGIKTPPEDVKQEFSELPMWMKNKKGRGYDEVAQEARQSGLLGMNEDLFVKLRELRAPKKGGKAEDYLDQARRDLEQQHYQTFLQSSIAQDDLFKTEKLNVVDRFGRYMTQAKSQGLNDIQARKWAMEKLAAEQKPMGAGMVVTPWESAKSGDITFVDQNGISTRLIERGIKSKGTAQELATKDGGEVMRDGPNTWAVVKREAPATKQGEFGGGVTKMGAEGELFQSKLDSPTFYSAVEKAIADKMPAKATGQDILGILKNTPGIKQEELDWMGLPEFLAGKKSVTKEEVQDFIRQNNVQIKEVVKAGKEGTVISRGGGLYDVRDGEGNLIGQHMMKDEAERLLMGGTRYGHYVIPGGENYQELLLMFPGKVTTTFKEYADAYRQGAPNTLDETIRLAYDAFVKEAKKGQAPDSGIFKSSHFDEPNILVHVRFNDRTDVEGKRVLFIEEVQSDWHQKGRERGYQDQMTELPNGIEVVQSKGPNPVWQIKEGERIIASGFKTSEDAKNDFLRSKWFEERRGEYGTVTNAPFKKTWHELALKRMLRYAAENGYDKLAWTTGEQQAERYDLSKQISAVDYQKYADGTYHLSAQTNEGRGVILGEKVQSDKLADIVGKDVAKRIVAGEGEKQNFAANNEVADYWTRLKGANLKVGGEGMKGFYDQIIPLFLNKYAKKWGGRVGDIELGMSEKLKAPDVITDKTTGQYQVMLPDGLPWGHFATRAEAIDAYRENFGPVMRSVHSLEITPSMRESVMAGQPLFQGDPETNPRGFIRFTPKEALIKLISADASTFPHELAHYWIKNFHEFIQTGQGTEQHQADWKVLADWLKVKEGQKELDRDQQEKFAKGFESYLREGKAPSEELRGVFAKFRRWLTRLYRDPITLGIELNDNVRGVMARMLASEDEIAFAEHNAGISDGKEYADIPNLDPKVRARLDSIREKARDEAMQQLLTPQMKEITEENKAFLAKEREKATADASKGMTETPELKAGDAIAAIFKKDAKDVASDYLIGKLSESDIDVLEVEAEKQGYTSADEMLKKISQAPSRDEQVKAVVDQHMEQFANMKDRAQVREEAMQAVHNEKQTELMALEASTFRMMVAEAQGRRFNAEQAARLAKLEAQAAKMQAEQLIGSKAVSEAGKFMPYFTAERNAAIRVQKALSDGDMQAAADAKRQQMLNHALVRESYAARQEITKSLAFFDRFASRKQDLKNIPYGFIRQIDTLLSDHGLAEPRAEDAQTYLAIAQDLAVKGSYPDEIAHRTGYVKEESGQWRQESISETIERIQNDYRNIAIPQSVLTNGTVNYRTMRMTDFRDLKQAVKAINAVGRGYDNFLEETIKMDRKTAAAKLRESIEKNVGTKYLEKRDIGAKPGETWFSSKGDAILNLPDAAIPSLVNLYSICDFLDAGNPDGLMKNLVYRQLLHGDEKELRMTESAKKDFGELLDQHFTKKEYARLRKDKVYIESRGRSMTKDEIMAFALNWGNETNRQRLRDGYNLNDQQVREILSNVDKKTWDFAQVVWDHLDNYWPQIVAQQEKVAGETPKRVTPAVVSTPYGDYGGGYYPLVYDSGKSSEAYGNLEARNALYKTMGAVMAHTSHGFTEARARNYSAPIRLDSRTMFTHLQDVIHDLSYRQPVIDVNGFLRQKDAREAIINAIGVRGMRTIEQHLKWVASDQGDYLSSMDRFLRKIRFGATVATLGLRPLQAPLSLGGNIINVLQDLGPVKFGNAIKEFLSNTKTNIQMIDSLSMRMKERALTRDRDLNDMAKRWQGNNILFGHYVFYIDSLADQAISYPLWLQTYRGSIDKYGQQKAIDMANEAVNKAMGSGSILDQAMIQRGSEAHKIASWWYSWSGMMFNRAWRSGKFAGLEYDKGNVGTALMITANAALYGFVLQAANENLWRELFRNSQDVDQEKRVKRVVERAVLQPISYVPILRELVEYGVKKASGGTGDLKLPFQSAAENIINPLADLARVALTDKELNPRFWENTARASAILLKYPQILNTWAFNFIDYLNDEGELTWKDLMSRKTKS